MRYSIALLALVATVFAAPVERRQSVQSVSASNSTENINNNNNQDLNNNLDLNNGQDDNNEDNNLDLNDQLNLNDLDLSNLNSDDLDLNDIDLGEIIDQIQDQIIAEQLLGGNNDIDVSNNNNNDVNDQDLNNNNNQDLQLNNFDLGGFNQLFDSSFNADSIVSLLEGLDNSNILDQNNLDLNNNNINLEDFADQFNEQNQAEWQANEILALIESISGNQNLQQLEDLAQLSNGLDNNNVLDLNNNNNDVVASQIEEISI